VQNRQRVTEISETYWVILEVVSQNTPLLGSSVVHFEYL